MTLEQAFEDVVLSDALIDRGGHWLCGVREFVFDPDLSGPQILPIVGGRIWGEELKPDTKYPLNIDLTIRDRLDNLHDVKTARIQRRSPPPLTPNGFVDPRHLIAVAFQNLRTDATDNEGEIAQIGSGNTSETTSDQWTNPWLGRERHDPIFGALDDTGYDVLMRVRSIFVGLRLGPLIGAEVYGLREPPTHVLHRDIVDSDWFGKRIGVDFARNVLFAWFQETQSWKLMFSDILICDRRYLDEELRRQHRNGSRALGSEDDGKRSAKIPSGGAEVISENNKGKAPKRARRLPIPYATIRKNVAELVNTGRLDHGAPCTSTRRALQAEWPETYKNRADRTLERRIGAALKSR